MRLSYTPITKARLGEIAALGTLPITLRGRVTAIIEVGPPGVRRTKHKPGAPRVPPQPRTVEEHVSGIASSMITLLAESGPRVYVDAWALGDEPMADGSHPLAYLVTRLIDAGVQAAPVVSARLSAKAQWVVSDLIKEYGPECCLRVRDSDSLPAHVLQDAVQRLESVGSRVNSAHLVLDMGAVPEERVLPQTFVAQALAKALAQETGWNSASVTATGYETWPKGVPKGGQSSLPRTELDIYEAVSAAGSGLRWTYGDYCVSGHAHPPISGFAQAGVKLRYTSANRYLLFYEGQFEDLAGEGFRPICQRLMKMPEFTQGLSWGDEFIEACANGGPTGGPQAWVTVGTSHHLLYVLQKG